MVTPFPTKLCIVDDDSDFTNFLAKYLDVRHCTSDSFSSAEALLKADRLEQYDFFILDLGLPGIDGVDLTTLLRARSSAGILVISGRMGADAFNSALSAGADMFINKPVRFDQVYHAIQSVWRRIPRTRAKAQTWRISRDGSALHAPNDDVIALTPVEARLINRLRSADDQAVSRADLAVAGEVAQSADHRNLDAAIFRLRRKIEKEAGCPSPFRTVHGVGYQLSETIALLTDADGTV